MNDSDQSELVESIKHNLTTGKTSTATLATDDRVLARITDGIYRQPASALRELIANAYDADAAHVWVQTERPRFRKMSVRDDGNGLSIESLARLIYHIGGSPKRTAEGAELGITSSKDATLSPMGRRLIGKIGIGLFSVAQLTRRFQIITKVAGADHRLVAEVLLKTYSEDELARIPPSPSHKVETGSVQIKSERASDSAAHGTEIVLLDVNRQTRELLQSQDMWLQVEAARDPEDEEDLRLAPSYHIARLDKSNGDLVRTPEKLPWTKTDPIEHRFGMLFQAVVEEVGESASNPRLENVLDNYLRTLWTLSLSAPLNYIEKHPFDMAGHDGLDVYRLSNDSRAQATQLKLGSNKAIRDALGLKAPERGSPIEFRVYVDDIELKRPLRFRALPRTHHILTDPLIFVGKAEPDLSKISKDERGGDLSFEAYFLWTPKVVPREHNGVLVRIGDASGTLFDETFMKYQVSELTRLKQITAEIFVINGLDAALNIDRESFNYAHPHYQYLMKWVHRSIRQLTNVHKTVSSERRTAKTETSSKARAEKLDHEIRTRLKRLGKNDETPEVRFVATKEDLKVARRDGALAFESRVIFADVPEARRSTKGQKQKHTLFQAQVSAVAKILDGYGVFENMPYDEQQDLLRAIVSVFVDKEGR